MTLFPSACASVCLSIHLSPVPLCGECGVTHMQVALHFVEHILAGTTQHNSAGLGLLHHQWREERAGEREAGRLGQWGKLLYCACIQHDIDRDGQQGGGQRDCCCCCCCAVSIHLAVDNKCEKLISNLDHLKQTSTRANIRLTHLGGGAKKARAGGKGKQESEEAGFV